MPTKTICIAWFTTALLLGACQPENAFIAPRNIAIPVHDFVHLSDDGPECNAERIGQLRWRSDRSLEICTSDMWRPIRVAANAGQVSQ